MDLAASIQAVTEEVDAANGARAASARPGMKQLVLAGGVALNCVGQRPAAARRAVRGHLDSAGGGRRRRRAGRGAVRVASVAREAARQPHGGHARRAACSGRSSRDRRRCVALLDRAGAPYDRAFDERGRAAAARRRVAGTRRRSSAGSRAGWSSARGRSAARSILGDAAVAEDAGDDEPEDQVPGELPAVRADACCGSEAHRLVRDRAGAGEPVHAARRAGAARRIACRSPTSSAR